MFRLFLKLVKRFGLPKARVMAKQFGISEQKIAEYAGAARASRPPLLQTRGMSEQAAGRAYELGGLRDFKRMGEAGLRRASRGDMATRGGSYFPTLATRPPGYVATRGGELATTSPTRISRGVDALRHGGEVMRRAYMERMGNVKNIDKLIAKAKLLGKGKSFMHPPYNRRDYMMMAALLGGGGAALYHGGPDGGDEGPIMGEQAYRPGGLGR